MDTYMDIYRYIWIYIHIYRYIQIYIHIYIYTQMQDNSRTIEQTIYPSLCSHDLQHSLANEIDLICLYRASRTHRISQLGKICNKCSQIIRDSIKEEGECIVCEGTIESYLRERELCQHFDRTCFDLTICCLTQREQQHEVPLSHPVCTKCGDRIRAAFMNAEGCSVCQGKEKLIMHLLEKAFVAPAYSHFKNIIEYMRDNKYSDQVKKREIQHVCSVANSVNHQTTIPLHIREQYEQHDSLDNHDSKRYQLYPKCRVHYQLPLSVCNECLVALLNLNSCPYGCIDQKPASTKKQVPFTISQTAFLNCTPLLVSEHTYAFEMFVLRSILEKDRTEKWEVGYRRVTAESTTFENEIGTYAAAVRVNLSNLVYLITGGVVNDTTSNKCFALQLDIESRKYKLAAVASMNESRASHAIAYDTERSIVYVVGGYAEGKYLHSGEMYTSEGKWDMLPRLCVERSKPTAMVYKGQLYVFGGMTVNAHITEIYAEWYNKEKNVFVGIEYSGYEGPSLTGCTPSTTLFDTDNILVFGGSDLEQSTNAIQELRVKDKTFEEKTFNTYTTNMEMIKQRVGCTLGVLKDMIICFGGVNQYEELLEVDIVKYRINDNKIQPIFVYDDVAVGSFKYAIRETHKQVYRRLYKMSGVQENKIRGGLNNVESPENAQYLEKMWYTVGKCYVWVPLK